jgi:uncharacterized protein
MFVLAATLCTDGAGAIVAAEPHWWEAGPALPKLTGRVVDGDDLLTPERKLKLETMLAGFERHTQHQFVIVTVNSLNGQKIEDFGVRLGRTWGIGRKDVNDGVLLIIAPKEHQVRIEVGYRLEKALPDQICARIIRNEILPAFRAGNMSGGIEKGAVTIIAALSR